MSNFRKTKKVYPAKTQTLQNKRWSQKKRWFCSLSLISNLIGFVIENLSYNWSIITYRNSNTNSIGVFHCIKLNLSTERSRDEERAKNRVCVLAGYPILIGYPLDTRRFFLNDPKKSIFEVK